MLPIWNKSINNLIEQKYLNLEQKFNSLNIENNLLQNKKDEMDHALFSLQNDTYQQGQEN